MKVSRTEPPAGRRAAIGAQWGPEGPWRRHGVPKGSKHQSCTNTGQSSDPSDDYMLRAALEGTLFFSGRKPTCPKHDSFFGFIVTRQMAMPIQIVPRFCAGGMVDSKSYCTVVKTHRDETSQVTDLSPGLSRSDNVLRQGVLLRSSLDGPTIS